MTGATAYQARINPSASPRGDRPPPLCSWSAQEAGPARPRSPARSSPPAWSSSTPTSRKFSTRPAASIRELLVHNGDHVSAGEIIVKLDDTQASANLAILTKHLDELMARQAREEAERDGADEITFPDALTSRSSDPDVAQADCRTAEAVRDQAQGAGGPEGAAD